MSNNISYHVSESGHYGEFGGAYIPEMLYANVEEIRTKYLDIIYEPDFQEEFNSLLKDSEAVLTTHKNWENVTFTKSFCFFIF